VSSLREGVKQTDGERAYVRADGSVGTATRLEIADRSPRVRGGLFCVAACR